MSLTARNPPATFYAPAGAESSDVLQHRRRRLAGSPLLQQTIDAMSDGVLILNTQRQIVGANRQLLELMGRSLDAILGQRVGELVGCVNASQGPNGCGTAKNCLTCGAVNALLECELTSLRVNRECRITLAEPPGEALDLSVSASRAAVDGEAYTICVLKDISDEKRLAVLARMFFHDVMNTIGGIQGCAQILRQSCSDAAMESETLMLLADLSDHLVEEVRTQRDLMYAEAGDLDPEFSEVSVPDLVQRVRAMHARLPAARHRRIAIGELCGGSLHTDPRLLARVLGNMLTNALEATAPNQCVTLGCRLEAEQLVFSVHNREVMSEEIQMQVFQRSFSTKARQGRGIGTHSMKLFGERYLGGRVSFTSREPEGTTFYIALPPSPHRSTE